MLNVEVVTKDNYKITVGRSLPSEAVLRNGLYPSRKYFKLMTAMDDIEESVTCEKVLIIGKEYIINNRRYDLESGYALVANMTPDFKIYPELRRAKGKEVKVIKNEDGFGMLDRWPVLKLIADEKEIDTNTETKDNLFIEKVMNLDIKDESFTEDNSD